MTAAERIRLALADAIVRGEIGPGVILDESSIAKRFQVSRTPVREAIRQLEAIGFAEARPHRGAVVPHFTADKLTEMFTVMAELEAVCAIYAAQSTDQSAREALRHAHQACCRAAETHDIHGYHICNLAFHEAIYAMSGNAYLADVTRGVRNRVEPFREAQFSDDGRLSASTQEHAKIMEAILRQDGETAASLMREHLKVVRRSVGHVAPSLRIMDGA